MVDLASSHRGTDDSRRLAARLVSDLRPVRRLPRPWLRALAFVMLLVAVAVAISPFADLIGTCYRITATPDMWLAVLGSTATAILASVASFQLCLPDRSRLWALLPLPGLLLWIAASGIGCARSWLIPGTHDASWAETRTCLTFIVGLSIPLSLVMVAMLRRAYTLTPTLTAGVAGLAVAAGAATLLNLFHPYDASLDDLLVHSCAVLLVVAANRAFGGRLLTRRDMRPKPR